MQPEQITLKVISLYISRTSGGQTEPVSEIHLRPEYGIVGDTHAGKTHTLPDGEQVLNLRHFTAVVPQELGEIAEAFGVPYLDPSWLSANICFAGLKTLTQTLVAGTLLFDAQGRAVLEIKGTVEPCLTMGERIAARYPHLTVKPEFFPKHSYGRRGVHGIALEEITLKLYDTLTAILPAR